MAERFMDVNEEQNYMNEEELDTLKAALAYLLIKNTEMDYDSVYDLVFQDEGRIVWH